MDELISGLKALRRRSFKEILVYVAICTLIIGVIFAMFAVGLSWDAFTKWVGLASFTGIIFWPLVSHARNLWKKRGFWIYLFACLLLHCAAWAAILIQTEHWKVIWFTPPMILEMLAFASFRDWLVRGTH